MKRGYTIEELWRAYEGPVGVPRAGSAKTAGWAFSARDWQRLLRQLPAARTYIDTPDARLEIETIAGDYWLMLGAMAPERPAKRTRRKVAQAHGTAAKLVKQLRALIADKASLAALLDGGYSKRRNYDILNTHLADIVRLSKWLDSAARGIGPGSRGRSPVRKGRQNPEHHRVLAARLMWILDGRGIRIALLKEHLNLIIKIAQTIDPNIKDRSIADSVRELIKERNAAAGNAVRK